MKDVGDPIAHHWSPDKYIRLVENTANSTLAEFQRRETEFITRNIKSPQDKTYIDVGAGYGRVLPHLSPIAKKVIAIELDEDMHSELERRGAEYRSRGVQVEIIRGDANELMDLLGEKDISRPVLLVLQNSLGTWIGDYHKALEQMRKLAENLKGEIVISLLNQEKLKELGAPMYEGLQEMVGELDEDASDFDGGFFRSKVDNQGNRYQSHWWRPEEREAIRNFMGGRLVAEVHNRAFTIFHFAY